MYNVTSYLLHCLSTIMYLFAHLTLWVVGELIICWLKGMDWTYMWNGRIGNLFTHLQAQLYDDSQINIKTSLNVCMVLAGHYSPIHWSYQPFVVIWRCLPLRMEVRVWWNTDSKLFLVSKFRASQLMRANDVYKQSPWQHNAFVRIGEQCLM